MPSASGEIQYDRDDLWDDAGKIAATLDEQHCATFHYGAFMTGWRMVVIDQELMARGVGLGNATPTGTHGGGYTLWLREHGDNRSLGPWLKRGQLHVPPYLAEKFGCPEIDALGIGVLMLMIEGARLGWSDAQVEETIAGWIQRMDGPQKALRGDEVVPGPLRPASFIGR